MKTGNAKNPFEILATSFSVEAIYENPIIALALV